MKIILSPAKTISKTENSIDSKENFNERTYEILKMYPEARLSNDLYRAFFMYDGLCYRSIKRELFDEKDMDYLRKHLYILSALYGALKPEDLISPYRLDFLMKTSAGNLYKFWNDEIAKVVLNDEDLIINIASDEFSKLIKKYITNETILDIEFYENKDGKLKKHSTISKKGRGYMLEFLVKEKVENVEDIKKFNYEGYKFSVEKSSEFNFVFIREN